MKKLYLILSLLCLLGCGVKDKIIEQQGVNLILQAMTTGQWKVTNYGKGGTDITGDFSVYQFQFKTNYTVDAINNGNLEKTGNWNAAGDLQAQTITANFTNATDPLALINGVWNINSTTWTSVNASQTVSGELRTLRLEKL